MNIREEKSQLRDQIINRLKTQHIKERNEKSKIIAERVVKSRYFLEAESIMLYAAMIYEVETIDIISHAFRCNKRVILPLVDKNKREIIPCEIKDFEKETHWCSYGFKEPSHCLKGNINRKEIDIVIVPGICFDKNNNRLGRGVGFYDRFLSTFEKTIKAIGLAFDFQMYDKIPTEKHDFVLTAVITNT